MELTRPATYGRHQTGRRAMRVGLPKYSMLAILAMLALTFSARFAFATSGCDGSGNCYIRSGASGSGTGATWTNAYSGFGSGTGKINPAGMARGVTYWIAAGAYGAQNFSTPDSGTTIITIEAATSSNHGPASDWNSSYAGQATFIGDNSISSDYWTFNGQTRGSDWQSSYNLKFWNQTDTSGYALGLGGNTGVTLKFVEVEGTGNTGGNFPNNTTADRCNQNNCGTVTDNGIYESSPISNFYLGYSYVHHTGNTSFQMDNTGNGGSVNSGVTWEYDWVSYNHTGQNGQHDEAYSLYGSSVVVRYSVFQDIAGTGIITDAGAATPPMSNWDIYGNIFFWDATYAQFNGQYSLATIDNGVVAFLGEQMSGHVYFYNNTMYGFYNSVANQDGAAFSTLALSGLSGESSGSPTVQIYNNLWFGSAYTTGDYTPYCQAVSGSCTQDYDAFYIGNVLAGDFQNPSETHGYTVSNSGTNPFTNAGSSTIAGFTLVTPDPFTQHTGTTLASPYNLDLYGTTRGANGVWDRGALQLPGSGGPPAPPTNLTVTGVQ